MAAEAPSSPHVCGLDVGCWTNLVQNNVALWEAGSDGGLPWEHAFRNINWQLACDVNASSPNRNSSFFSVTSPEPATLLTSQPPQAEVSAAAVRSGSEQQSDGGLRPSGSLTVRLTKKPRVSRRRGPATRWKVTLSPTRSSCCSS